MENWSFPLVDGNSLGARKMRSLDSGADLRRLAIVRYLSRLIHHERSEASETLDGLARLLGGTNAFAFPWERLSAQDLPAPEELRHRFSHGDLSRAKRVLNGVLREAVLLGLMSSGDYSEIRGVSWNKVRATPWAHGVSMWSAVESIFSACMDSDTPASRRDGGLFGLIWVEQSGIKDAISFPNSTPELWIRTECSSNRLVPAVVSQALMRWREIRGTGLGTFLTSISRTGAVIPIPMTAHTAEYAFRRRCEQAGIARLGAEDLRQLATKLDL
jgi:hypothetical protein